MSARFANLLSRFRRSEKGLAALELALFSPLLTLMLLGGYDMARFISIRSSVDKVGFSVADVTSQYDVLTSGALTQIFQITGSSLPSYVSGTNGVTILTSIYLDSSSKPKVRWQCFSSSGSAWTSKIGVEGGAATVNTGLISDTNDNLMVAEVYYQFKPVFARFFKNNFMMYNASFYRPRLGSLTTKPC